MLTAFSIFNLLLVSVVVAVGSSEYLRGGTDTVVHFTIPIIDPVGEVAVVRLVIFGTTTPEFPQPVFFPIVMDALHTSKNIVSRTLKHYWQVITILHPTPLATRG